MRDGGRSVARSILSARAEVGWSAAPSLIQQEHDAAEASARRRSPLLILVTSREGRSHGDARRGHEGCEPAVARGDRGLWHGGLGGGAHPGRAGGCFLV